MAKTIKGSEIIEDKHLRDAIKEAESLKKAYDSLDSVVKVLAADVKAMAKSALGNTAKDIQLLSKAIQDSTKVRIAAIKLDEEQIKLQKEQADLNKKLEQSERERLRTEQEKLNLDKKLAQEAERKIKSEKRLAEETRKLNSVYEQNKKRLNEMARSLKELESRGRGGGIVAKGLRQEFDKLHKSVFNAEKSVGQFQRNVGNYPKVIGNAVNSMRNFAASFGLVLGASTVLRDIFGTISKSEDAFASLSAITGLTGDKFKVFKTAIMETANELNVSGTLVAEAAEKIASAQPALLDDADALAAVTKEAITLNKAIKGDLTESSMALVGVMNQFGLSAEDANRVINILAAGSQAGAATVNQINDSMVKFGTTADLMNISVEESVALIETLGEKAIFGEQAGTALRNILLKMGSIDVLPEKALDALEKYGVNTDIVKDNTLSLEERLTELSKIAKDSTAIMQVFGTENATAATVLLNNLDTYDKMNVAVTGTNTATEQAAINSDTLSAVLGELRAAWENLVIKWSEGTDVAGGLKSVLRFLAENLETIIDWVIRGITAWGTYKATMMLYRTEVNDLGQTIKKGLIPSLTSAVNSFKGFGAALKSIPIGGWVAILTTLIPLVWDWVAGLTAGSETTQALARVTEKYNEKMIEERSKMDLLYQQILQTNAGSKEREGLIKRINDTYGTTLQNLSDETAFMQQLAQAYRDVTKEMEKKIMAQILEEELMEAFKKKRAIELQLKEWEGTENSSWFSGTMSEELRSGLEETNTLISNLQKQMFLLNKESEGVAGKSKLTRPMKTFADDVEEVGDNVSTTTEKVEDLKTEVEEINKLPKPEIMNVEGLTGNEFDPKDNWFVSGLMAANEEMIRLEEEARERRKKMAEETIELLKKVTDAMIAEADKQIEKEKEKIEASKSEIDYLREQAKMGNVDAAESIKAEQVAQAKQLLEIEKLERKKRNLLVLTTALESASQKINNGDSNAFKNAGQEISDFIAKLPKFYAGTETTIADALGKPDMKGKDGYIVRVDGKEKVLNPVQSAMTGSMTTDEIASAAFAYRNNQMIAGGITQHKSTSTNQIVDRLYAVEKAIKGIDIPEHQFNFDQQSKMWTETIKMQNKIQKNHYKTGGLFS